MIDDDDVEFVHLQADAHMSGEDEDEETRKVISTEALNDEIREAVENKEVNRIVIKKLIILILRRLLIL